MPRTATAVRLDELDELYETAQLADQLHISARTLEGWRHRGTGPRFVKAGRRVLYRKSAVERWLHAIAKDHTRA